jgi:hypothetical protein
MVKNTATIEAVTKGSTVRLNKRGGRGRFIAS